MNPNVSNRHAFRADWDNYNSGLFFVTFCCERMRCLLGSIKESEIALTPLGQIVNQSIESLNSHHSDTVLCNYTIMPNHVHLIVYIDPVGARNYNISSDESSSEHKNAGCLKPPMHDQACIFNHHNSRLAVVIGSLKAAVTRQARIMGLVKEKIWQRSFHDHIIRTQRSFENIMDYIDNNPSLWHNDCFNPDKPLMDLLCN